MANTIDIKDKDVQHILKKLQIFLYKKKYLDNRRKISNTKCYNLFIKANYIENVNIAHLSILHLSSVQVLQEILH